MAANAPDNERVVLLIFPLRKQFFPISTAALKQACTPRQELMKDRKNAFILDRDGSLRRIEHIEVIGAAGDSMLKKALSWLTNAWTIEVTLSEPLLWSLEKLKQTLVECIDGQGYVFDDEAENATYIEHAKITILAASSATEIFNILEQPLEGALDVL